MKKSAVSLLILFLFVLYACQESTSQNKVISTGLTAQLRAPAYPLITSDPYFSGWSYANNLYDDQTRHWTGKEFPLVGALRVDGETYRFMGKESLPLHPILETAKTDKWQGQYTFDKPKNDKWISVDFDDTAWKTGAAAFGTPREPNLSTRWQTSDIWVRRSFELSEDLSGKTIFLNYSHDDIFELYINGIKIVDTGYSWKYNVNEELSDEVKAALKKGKNVIAAHCHNRTGGGYVDFGLFEKETDKESFTNTAVQKSVSVLPTQTIYSFECGAVELQVIFTAPLLLDDLELVSRPINYISYQVKSLDGQAHDTQIYLETTPQLAVNSESQAVDFEKIDKKGFAFLKTGTKEQPILKKRGDDIRIDWGYLYLAAKSDKSSVLAFGDYWTAKKEFQSSGSVSATQPDSLPEKMDKAMTVLSYSRDLGKVASDFKTGHVLLGYDDIYSIQYFEKNLKGYWTNDGKTDIFAAFASAEKDYASIMDRCNAFNEQMMADAKKSGGEKYAELCALAYRQSISAHKLVKDEDGTLLFLSKENNSNGCINTVDVTYPSEPLFLLYNNELAKGMLSGIFYYCENGKWKYPFAPHDLGTYPQANGQVYGMENDEYGNKMPVEESGNVLILTAAIAQVDGNADYAAKHWQTLTTWAEFLVEYGVDPENQLCTDDFAGHLAHNANLSIKAVMGVASYGKLAGMLGKNDIAEKYLNIAKGMAAEWQKMADDGDHYRLAFDRPGSWSQKYNLVWDKLLGFNIFDPQIAKTEIAYYLTKQNAYGLPLDSRKTYTKTDWILWTAAMTDNAKDFEAFSDLVYKYADETTSRVPLSDWHETVDGRQVGFKARSVVGGYFMKMLSDKILSEGK
ncbi:MAG: DUF4965 domain-containing protein [Dysgonamonadaceae bacterium]|jgi:hypothetical protein|nr:DUF4965 domain-containing protein [Dysgonamonadaceae bacterium]